MKIQKSLPSAASTLMLMVTTTIYAQPILLQRATADFSENAPPNSYLVSQAIDGVFAWDNGWAIYPEVDTNHAAVFQTVTDIGYASGTILIFKLYQLHGPPHDLVHELGRFRLSLTIDDRNSYADGLPTGGSVDANWLPLNPGFMSSANGATLSNLSDNSILVSGFLPDTDIYTVVAFVTNTGITGFRLDALADPSLPAGGPGRNPFGNFVLTELTASSAPAPGPVILSFPTNVVILLPAFTPAFILEASSSLTPPIQWQQVTNQVSLFGGVSSVSVALDVSSRFFRLRQP